MHRSHTPQGVLLVHSLQQVPERSYRDLTQQQYAHVHLSERRERRPLTILAPSSPTSGDMKRKRPHSHLSSASDIVEQVCVRAYLFACSIL